MIDDAVLAEAGDVVRLDASGGERVDFGVDTVDLRCRKWGFRERA